MLWGQRKFTTAVGWPKVPIDFVPRNKLSDPYIVKENKMLNRFFKNFDGDIKIRHVPARTQKIEQLIE